MTAAAQRQAAAPRLKVMMPGMARLLLAAGSTLTLVACGSTTAPAAGNGSPARAGSPAGTGTPATHALVGTLSSRRLLRHAAAPARLGGRRDQDRASPVADTAGDQG